MLRGAVGTRRGNIPSWHAKLLPLACLVIACVGRAEDLEVHSVCNAQERAPPYNYELCRDPTGIPFPVSTVIVGAKWISEQSKPAPTSGDHLQTTWAPDGNAYVAFDDEISGSNLYVYLAKVTGTPPNLTFTRQGSLVSCPVNSGHMYCCPSSYHRNGRNRDGEGSTKGEAGVERS